MLENESEDLKPRPGTSEDISRVVEFLINLLFRWTCLAIAGAFGLLAIVALTKAWTWWIAIPAVMIAMVSLILSLLSFVFAPKGKLVFDSKGPMVFVPSKPSAADAARFDETFENTSNRI